MNSLKNNKITINNEINIITNTLELKKKDYSEIKLLANDSLHLKEVAYNELIRIKNKYDDDSANRLILLRERKQVVELRKQMKERHFEREKIRAKLLENEKLEQNLLLYNKMNAATTALKDNVYNKNKLNIFEEGFLRIKEITGESNIINIINKLKNQNVNTNELLSITKNNTNQIENLHMQYRTLKIHVEELKYLYSSGNSDTNMSNNIEQHKQVLSDKKNEINNIHNKYEKYIKLVNLLVTSTIHIYDIIIPLKTFLEIGHNYDLSDEYKDIYDILFPTRSNGVVEVTEKNVADILTHIQLLLELCGKHMSDPDFARLVTGVATDLSSQPVLLPAAAYERLPHFGQLSYSSPATAAPPKQELAVTAIHPSSSQARRGSRTSIRPITPIREYTSESAPPTSAPHGTVPSHLLHAAGGQHPYSPRASSARQDSSRRKDDEGEDMTHTLRVQAKKATSNLLRRNQSAGSAPTTTSATATRHLPAVDPAAPATVSGTTPTGGGVILSKTATSTSMLNIGGKKGGGDTRKSVSNTNTNTKPQVKVK